MLFVILILLTAFLMEGVGSYISVIGLSALFSGDMVIIAMAVILDIAKVTTVSFLYQYWGDVKKTMRAYMLAAVLVLMTITSAGAFGYLSGAFQKAVQPNREVMLKVDSLTREMKALEAEKKELTDTKLKINQQIANVPTSTEDTARRRLIYSFKPELDRTSKRLEVVNKRVDELRGQVLKAESENIEKDVHTGPITYVSKAFGLSLEDSSKYIILLIVLVFDPLAIMLVLAGNFLILRQRDEEKQEKLADISDLEYFSKRQPSDLRIPPDYFKQPEEQKVEPEPQPVELAEPEQPQPEPKLAVNAKRIRDQVNERARKVSMLFKPQPVEEVKPVEVTVEQLDLPPQAELIAEEPLKPARSSLSDLKVGIESALFKHGVTPDSKKRSFYAS